MDGFVHLHVHTHYSLLDGAIRIKDLVKSAKAMGMPAVAISDHGNLFGAMEFYAAAREEGVKPILGLEAYISPTTRQDRSMGNPSTASYHLLLLAMNKTGFDNLLKLSSRSWLEGFYYKPRIDRELLGQFSEGLIATTACLGGEVPSAFLANQPQAARRIAGEYLDIFGKDRFFIEVQQQGLADQDRANVELVTLARDLGVGLVGTNDVHFLRREDKKAHEVLCCVSTGKTLAESTELIYPPELYFKSPAEMRQALAGLGEAADNTLRIAEMCNVELNFTEHLPVFRTPNGEQADDYLAALARKGLADRFEGTAVPDAYGQRLERELAVIQDKGYSSYFLIVWDLSRYARENRIPAAPRGSGVGTLLGYALNIADVDPIRYGLLFERFTDPARKEAPDIDIDLCQEGRDKVIQYVRQKYGHVAQIITYGTLKAKAVVRDVGRVLALTLPEVDVIAKKVPDELKMTLSKALVAEPELQAMYDADPRVRDLIEYGKTLEGLARHAGVHAAGVIIADEPLENIVPLCKQSDSDDAITQWDGPTCDKIGLMKMDFLGLRTLTIIQRARERVAERIGTDIDPEKLPLDDQAVYELFRRGFTDGVFQFESDGMRGVLMQMQPNCIEDLIAANAMYRPGPMELIPTYCARKHGKEAVPSLHALVDDILAETYGIMCYQEQVMQVLNRLGKLPLARALTLIKAISKKKAKTIEEEKPNFLAGAKENGIDERQAQEIFELILKFAGYGFNKSHSTRYAIVAYQTAYFKQHYPKEFLAATMTFECGDQAKIVQYMSEAGRMGIKVLPPDINSCQRDFVVDGEAVRFGLSAVKGIGDKAVDAITAARGSIKRFEDLYHFCKSVDLRLVNRATLEALIKCGAFDSLGAHRAGMIAALEQAVELGQQAADDRKSGQMNIFDMLGAESGKPADRPAFPKIEPWSESQLLAAEKETLGFYITSHPLVRYARELDSLSMASGEVAAGQKVNLSVAQLENFPDGTRINVGCMIASIRPTVTKNGKSAGKKMAMLTLEDVYGKVDAVCFSETYERLAGLIVPEAMVFIAGTLDKRREKPNIIVDEIVPIDQALETFTSAMLLRLPPCGPGSEFLNRLKDILVRHHGNAAVYFDVRPAGRNDVSAILRPATQWYVKPTRKLLDELVGLLGEEKIRLRAKPLTQPQRRNQWSQRGEARGQSGPASEAVTRFN
ncbi:MAG: DNA polymerase III subunit alpha [Phycisphaerae bacterium]|nr:DNA polymerase III subunit alpha [Phycisphaerae bacterium]